ATLQATTRLTLRFSDKETLGTRSWEQTFVTAQPHAHVPSHRAIERRALWLAEDRGCVGSSEPVREEHVLDSVDRRQKEKSCATACRCCSRSRLSSLRCWVWRRLAGPHTTPPYRGTALAPSSSNETP